jgi:guanylate kinase
MPQGPLVILSGPSGSGKTTLVKRLLGDPGLRLRRAVTATTRPPRDGERDGQDYHFWARERFEEAARSGELLESAVVHGQLYGTPRSEVEEARARGEGVILVIDVQGASRVRRLCPEALTVFLRAPSFEEYQRRLAGPERHESPASITRRLETARRELEHAGEYDKVVINDNLEVAVAEVKRYIAERFA